MIRRFCAYGLELKDSDGFTHDWCTLIPALELAYKTSIHASTGNTPAMLQKGWDPKLPVDTLKKDLVNIHPAASRFKLFLDKVRYHSNKSMNDPLECAKRKWDKSRKTPEFNIGDLILVSTLKLNNIKGPKILKDSLAGPFIIIALHGKNAVQVELSGELENKHPNFTVSLTIGENKHQKFAFLPFKRQITVNKVSPVSLELEKFKSEQLKEAEISLHLTDKQENELSSLLYDHKGAFASEKEPLGAIIGHEVDIIFNIERLYPPLLRRPAYPASPKSREAPETHIKELLGLGVIRKVGHNEEVEITTPVIVAWHNGKSRMVGDFRALKIYPVPDRYPIPKIQITLDQISQAVYITTIDAFKGFHENVVTPRERK
ncbi:hypothetical protein O181_037014 [Austropuccinia psidii MF-1]|uniref:Integrase catalytic domain-containing protein n=1 Tax=Austropuccinia psidii MF-1 TaxID=1389203 RepID=A0A9Q3D5M3_9BASI|nr:hypothetical protein [Austropuccinia psidii MF-1]